MTTIVESAPPPPATISFTAGQIPVMRDDGELTVASFVPPANATQQPPTASVAPPLHVPDAQEITLASSSSTLQMQPPPQGSQELAVMTTDNENHVDVDNVPTETALVVAAPRDLVPSEGDGPVSVQAPAKHKTYPPEVEKMKKNRKRLTVAAGVAGGLAGLVALGPIGAVVGGAGGAVATRAIGKRRERKKREKIANKTIEEQCRDAPEVAVHSSEFL